MDKVKVGNAPIPNYGKLSIKEKIIKRLRNQFATAIENTPFQFKVYPSYWHSLKKKQFLKSNDELLDTLFITQKPDYGAGIGHQLANWNTGFHFAFFFKIKYAHTPFSSPKWENLLGFGEGETKVEMLLKSPEYKKIRLPRFDSVRAEHIDIIKSIIESYKGQKVLFQLEINQGYTDQYGTSKLISRKFFNATSRKNDKLIFETNSYNIAIHIRRKMSIESEEVWKERGLENNYFSKILTSILSTINTERKINIYLFSQGTISDFPEFIFFQNLYYCMEMNPYDSFLHMVHADILISSKSSFSYKPALISKGIKICPSSFWHGYPSTEDFILANNDSSFDTTRLLNVNLNLFKT